MSAATTPINTPEAPGDFTSPVPLLNGVIVYVGTLLAITAAGYGKPAADVAGLRVLGVVQPSSLSSVFDNTAGGAGAMSVLTKRGAFILQNSTTQPVTQADLGANVFAEDDNTVAHSTTYSLIAGVFLGFYNGDATQVIVDITSLAPAASA
jgi:hypothetical protein